MRETDGHPKIGPDGLPIQDQSECEKDVKNTWILLSIQSIQVHADDSNVGAPPAPANDSSWTWAWTFTKSFLTFAGGRGNLPTCAGQAIRHMGETLNPFTPGLDQAVAPVAQAGAINQRILQTQVGIDAYVASRGLTVPLRSGIVQAMAAEGAESAIATGAKANVATQTLAVDYAAVDSTITTAGEARNGQCAAAFPIF